MSVTLSSDVLVHASNRSSANFRASRSLVEQLAAGPELVYLFWPTLMAYVAGVTDAGRFPHPLSLREATSNVSALLERPHVRAPGELNGFWGYFLETTGSHTRGDEVADAHLATLMRQHSVATIFTYNPSFRRYPGIQVREPALPASAAQA